MARGMLTPEQLAKMVEAEAIETVILGFPDHFGRLMGKRLARMWSRITRTFSAPSRWRLIRP